MEEWDTDKVSEYYLFQAEEADKYLEQVKVKLKDNSSYESVFDEHKARFEVFYYLQGRSFLSSKNELLAELNRMLSYEITPGKYYDIERFESFRKGYINNEISKYKNT